MQIIYTIVVVLLLFGLTIFVHELGHFLAARALGVIVETFSIGFGPAIWKRKINNITYRIGCLPLGGYVALPQIDGSANKEGADKKLALPAITPWKKLIVALAGATGNVILAVFIAFIVYWFGTSSLAEPTGTIGYVATNSSAYAAGLRPGDTITSVNNKPVNDWEDIMISSALSESVTITYTQPAGATKTVTLPTEEWPLGGRGLGGLLKSSPCLVIGVMPNSSAQKAGIRQKDIITSFAGRPVYSREQLIETVDQYRNQTVEVRVHRGRNELTLQVTPAYNEKVGRALIGVEFNPIDIYRRPMSQIYAWASPVFRLLAALVTPSESRHAAAAVGGPVAIFHMFWLAVQSSFLLALWFTGLINVNLAILNLLPIPVLDGGHIVFAIIEAIRRKPLSEKFIGFLTNVFATLLILLFLILSVRDVRRFILPHFSKDNQTVSAPAEK